MNIEIGSGNSDLQNVVRPEVLRPKLLPCLSLSTVQQIVEPDCEFFREKIEVEITGSWNLSFIMVTIPVLIWVFGLQNKK